MNDLLCARLGVDLPEIESDTKERRNLLIAKRELQETEDNRNTLIGKIIGTVDGSERDSIVESMQALLMLSEELEEKLETHVQEKGARRHGSACPAGLSDVCAVLGVRR